ncbi:MAG: ubiquitin carboxyl-terminal hydrolase [Holosporales bacterium]|jgi:ubiquitin C-terminal hydrolase|nr:ubiquitin carboxyl-terminal hydrolase [Holosporales bacterium]
MKKIKRMKFLTLFAFSFRSFLELNSTQNLFITRSNAKVIKKYEHKQTDETSIKVLFPNPRTEDESGQATSLPEPRPVPFGLINIMATCYFNSVLQVLYASPIFRDQISAEGAQGGRICDGVRNIFRVMENKEDSLVPSIVNFCITEIAKTFEAKDRCDRDDILAGTQCDAVDLIDTVINVICREHPEFKDTFSFLTKTIKCSKDPLHTNHSDLNVVIELPVNSNNMQDCVASRLVDEKIESWKCKECDDKLPATRIFNLQTNDILVLSLARFKYSPALNYFTKLYDEVSYDDFLVIDETTYRLIAIVKHCGYIDGGHYVATVLGADGKWYTQNDDKTKCHGSFIASKEHDKDNTPYIFIYERIH